MLDKLAGFFGVDMGAMKSAGDQVQREFPAAWVLSSMASWLTSLLLQRAYAAGAPADLATRLKLTQEQTDGLYKLVLNAALTRERETQMAPLPAQEITKNGK